jgi:5-methyltetrahydrofolate--homocysteine methyltransferase
MAPIRNDAASGPMLLDGAWGTELQALGLEPGACPDVWNLTHPAQVESVACGYVSAGSQVILTNTFGANRVALERHGLAAQAIEINRAGAEISCRAAAGNAQVYASIGPSGKLLTLGEISRAQLADVFGEQARALASGGAAGLVLETFTDLDELRIALGSAQDTGLPVAACMVFDSGAAKDRTAMGATVEQAVKCLTDAGVDIIGANCGRGVEGYIPICRRMRALTDRTLWFKPNAGLPKMVQDRIMYEVSPVNFAAGILELIDAGANWVGGCCGSTPAFIRALAQALGRKGIS